MNNDRENPAIIIAVVGGLITLLLLLLWMNFKTQIAEFSLLCSQISLIVLEWLHKNAKPLVYILYPSTFHDAENIEFIKNLYRIAEPEFMTANEINQHFNFLGYLIRWSMLFFAPYFIIKCWKYSAIIRSTKRFYNVHELFEYSQSEYPHLRPALSQYLHLRNPDIGIYRREDTQIRTAIKAGMIKAYTKDKRGKIIPELYPVKLMPLHEDENQNKKQKSFEFKNIDGVKTLFVKDHITKGIAKIHDLCVFDYSVGKKYFIKQLGPKFQSVNKLSTARKALLGVFILYAQGGEKNKKKAFQLLRQFNTSWDWRKVHCKDHILLPRLNGNPEEKIKYFEDDYIDLTGIDEIYEEFWDTEVVQDLVSQHAYELTLIAAMLEKARTKGKLYNSFWGWLLPVDRTMHFLLDAMGGDTCWSEAQGPFSHLLAEQDANVKLTAPQIEQALNGLVFYIDHNEGWLLSEDTEKKIREIVGRK